MEVGRGLACPSTDEGLRRTARAVLACRSAGGGGRVRSLGGEKVSRTAKVSGEAAILATTAICLAGGLAASCRSMEDDVPRQPVICLSGEKGRVSRGHGVSRCPAVLATTATVFQVAQPIRSSPEKAPTASIVALPSLEVTSSSVSPVDSVAGYAIRMASSPEMGRSNRSAAANGRLLHL